ncbi:hypothetical protein JCM10213_001759 [Rhodosporidiobolus nylandii]
MKFTATTAAIASLLLASSSSALPADTGATIAKVGDKPDVELFSRRSFGLEKREALPNPKAQYARPDWRTMSATTTTQLDSHAAGDDHAGVDVFDDYYHLADDHHFARSHYFSRSDFEVRSAVFSRCLVPPVTNSSASDLTSLRTFSAAPTSAAGSPQATATRASTTTTSAAPSSTAGANIRDAALNEHNRFRALHGANALVWDQTLADAAAKWAANCVFQHSQGAVGPYGENLAANAGTGPQPSQTQIVVGLIGLWEDEASDYDPSNPVYSHFTQMVWKSTTNLGCAMASCPGGTIFDAQYGNSNYLVCEYSPPGNVYPADNFRANVQP